MIRRDVLLGAASLVTAGVAVQQFLSVHVGPEADDNVEVSNPWQPPEDHQFIQARMAPASVEVGPEERVEVTLFLYNAGGKDGVWTYPIEVYRKEWDEERGIITDIDVARRVEIEQPVDARESVELPVTFTAPKEPDEWKASVGAQWVSLDVMAEVWASVHVREVDHGG